MNTKQYTLVYVTTAVKVNGQMKPLMISEFIETPTDLVYTDWDMAMIKRIELSQNFDRGFVKIKEIKSTENKN